MGIFDLDFGSIIQGVGSIIDDIHTSDEEELKIALQQQELEAGLVAKQIDVNKAQAQHKSVFVAGMRPFIGWVCGTALAYKFLLHPMACWLLVVLQGFGVLEGVAPPPGVNVTTLYPLILGMLGIGGMRSWDKMRGVSTESIR